mmetsp:Transcript_55250/g.131720  ORF Transcript_55250/g.131720 Transcript_55250/m.131720 type:complete len:170 (-) Transcript_55250:336-845(-)
MLYAGWARAAGKAGYFLQTACVVSLVAALFGRIARIIKEQEILEDLAHRSEEETERGKEQTKKRVKDSKHKSLVTEHLTSIATKAVDLPLHQMSEEVGPTPIEYPRIGLRLTAASLAELQKSQKPEKMMPLQSGMNSPRISEVSTCVHVSGRAGSGSRLIRLPQQDAIA